MSEEILDNSLSSAMPLILQVYEVTEKQVRKRKATVRVFHTDMLSTASICLLFYTHPILLKCLCKDQEGGGRGRDRGSREGGGTEEERNSPQADIVKFLWSFPLPHLQVFTAEFSVQLSLCTLEAQNSHWRHLVFFFFSLHIRISAIKSFNSVFFIVWIFLYLQFLKPKSTKSFNAFHENFKLCTIAVEPLPPHTHKLLYFAGVVPLRRVGRANVRCCLECGGELAHLTVNLKF